MNSKKVHMHGHAPAQSGSGHACTLMMALMPLEDAAQARPIDKTFCGRLDVNLTNVSTTCIQTESSHAQHEVAWRRQEDETNKFPQGNDAA